MHTTIPRKLAYKLARTCENTHKLAVLAHLVTLTRAHAQQRPDSNQQIAERKPVTCEEPHS